MAFDVQTSGTLAGKLTPAGSWAQGVTVIPPLLAVQHQTLTLNTPGSVIHAAGNFVWLMIQNLGATTISIRLDGVVPTTVLEGIVLAPGAIWMQPAIFCPIGAITGYSATPNTAILFSYVLQP